MHEDRVDALLDNATRRFYGKYRGVVVDNVDPSKRGRLEVSVPAVLGDTSVWALPCVPYAGQGVGFYALPDVGTGIWVEFEAGHASYPIWVGCFWGDNQIDSADAAPAVKFLKTTALTIRIDDDAGELVIQNQQGASFKLTPMEIVQKANSVTQTTDATKTVLDATRFDVNNGAFTVV